MSRGAGAGQAARGRGRGARGSYAQSRASAFLRSGLDRPRRSAAPRSVTTTSTSWAGVDTGLDSLATSVGRPPCLLGIATMLSPPTDLAAAAA